MFLSREIDIKLFQIYTKIHMQFCKKVVVLNRSYSENKKPIAETDYIPQEPEPENLRFAPIIIFIFILHF